MCHIYKYDLCEGSESQDLTGFQDLYVLYHVIDVTTMFDTRFTCCLSPCAGDAASMLYLHRAVQPSGFEFEGILA